MELIIHCLAKNSHLPIATLRHSMLDIRTIPKLRNNPPLYSEIPYNWNRRSPEKKMHIERQKDYDIITNIPTHGNYPPNQIPVSQTNVSHPHYPTYSRRQFRHKHQTSAVASHLVTHTQSSNVKESLNPFHSNKKLFPEASRSHLAKERDVWMPTPSARQYHPGAIVRVDRQHGVHSPNFITRSRFGRESQSVAEALSWNDSRATSLPRNPQPHKPTRPTVESGQCVPITPGSSVWGPCMP